MTGVDTRPFASYNKTMATECYKIEWTGLYSLSQANSRPEAKKLGLYMIYPSSSSTTPLYIGKSTELGRRINTHRQSWQHLHPGSGLDTLRIRIGVVTSLDGKPATPKQLSDVEKLYICDFRPKGNARSTMLRYTGRSIIVVGITKTVRSIHTSDKQLVKLIKGSTVV